MFGSKFELTEKQTSKLNSLLPESLKLETFEKKDFDAIVYRMQDRIYELENLVKENKTLIICTLLGSTYYVYKLYFNA